MFLNTVYSQPKYHLLTKKMTTFWTKIYLLLGLWWSQFWILWSNVNRSDGPLRGGWILSLVFEGGLTDQLLSNRQKSDYSAVWRKVMLKKESLQHAPSWVLNSLVCWAVFLLSTVINPTIFQVFSSAETSNGAVFGNPACLTSELNPCNHWKSKTGFQPWFGVPAEWQQRQVGFKPAFLSKEFLYLCFLCLMHTKWNQKNKSIPC